MKLCGKVLISIFVIFCCIGCNERITLLHTYHNLPEAGWDIGENINWELPSYSNKQIQASVEVCYTQKYQYANLWVECCLLTLSNQLIDTDTLMLKIKQNQRLGQVVESLNIDMQCADSTRLEVRHLMPDSLLKGISAVGIRVKPMPIDEHGQHQSEGK